MLEKIKAISIEQLSKCGYFQFILDESHNSGERPSNLVCLHALAYGERLLHALAYGERLIQLYQFLI